MRIAVLHQWPGAWWQRLLQALELEHWAGAQARLSPKPPEGLGVRAHPSGLRLGDSSPKFSSRWSRCPGELKWPLGMRLFRARLPGRQMIPRKQMTPSCPKTLTGILD